MIIAHRGHSSVAPEKTLAAFKSALKLDIEAID
jgi:glycerophosphoryl diester phosphodiesterase